MVATNDRDRARISGISINSANAHAGRGDSNTSTGTDEVPTTSTTPGSLRVAPVSPISLPFLLAHPDIFAYVCCFIEGDHLGLVTRVCRTWHAQLSIDADPMIWGTACRQAFSRDSPAELQRKMARIGQRSFRTLYISRPHLRFDGTYILESVYFRAGGFDGFGTRDQKRVLEIRYFRYLHFFPHGVCLVGRVNVPPPFHHPLPLNHKLLHRAEYQFAGRTVLIQWQEGDTLFFYRLLLHETEPHLNNRLSIQSYESRSLRTLHRQPYRVPSTPFRFWKIDFAPIERYTPGSHTHDIEVEEERDSRDHVL